MKYSFTNRNIHRDLAYFFLGLILAFSLSGIILNHRQQWYPMEYAYQSEPIALQFSNGGFEETDIGEMINSLGYAYQSHRVRGQQLRVDLADGGIIEADVQSGKGTLEYRRTVPFIGHTIILHKSTNNFWIWYSDIFGAAMIVIAMTGMLIPTGKYGFGQRGWKMMVIGLVFPLIFLLFF